MQKEVDEVEAAFWKQREVDMLHVELERFVPALAMQFDAALAEPPVALAQGAA